MMHTRMCCATRDKYISLQYIAITVEHFFFVSLYKYEQNEAGNPIIQYRKIICRKFKYKTRQIKTKRNRGENNKKRNLKCSNPLSVELPK